MKKHSAEFFSQKPNPLKKQLHEHRLLSQNSLFCVHYIESRNQQLFRVNKTEDLLNITVTKKNTFYIARPGTNGYDDTFGAYFLNYELTSIDINNEGTVVFSLDSGSGVSLNITEYGKTEGLAKEMDGVLDITNLTFNHSGTLIAGIATRNAAPDFAIIWGKTLEVIPNAVFPSATCITFDKSDQLFATGHSIKKEAADDENMVYIRSLKPDPDCPIQKIKCKTEPKALKFSHDGQMIAILCKDSSIRIWNIKENLLHKDIEPVESVAFSAFEFDDHKFFMAGTTRGEVYTWDFEHNKFIGHSKLPLHNNFEITGIIMPNNTNQVMIVSDNYISRFKSVMGIHLEKMDEKERLDFLEGLREQSIEDNDEMTSTIALRNSNLFCFKSMLL